MATPIHTGRNRSRVESFADDAGGARASVAGAHAAWLARIGAVDGRR